ncbi:MAG: Abi family protein [Bacteroidota bacterium]
MKYSAFEKIMSATRIGRYLSACGNNTKRTMTLYRLNLRLSQELFTIVSCFEVALRNAINNHYTPIHGNDWLRNSAMAGGFFNIPQCQRTARILNDAVRNLGAHYTHFKLLAELDFGFWRYLFAQPQFRAGGQTLLQVFPAKPTSTPAIQYNHTFVFNQLGLINDLRNRIAHHEPICFLAGQPVKDTTYARQHYGLILQLFQWMSIDEGALLYGLDHINRVCTEIDQL